jgi:carbon-monoxide dehydrogenase iron sulfur subunit
MNKMIAVDASRCFACRACEIACAVEHSESKSIVEAMHEKKMPVPRIILEWTGDQLVPVHCRHCEDAPCIAVCPAGALARSSDNNPVVLDVALCIGCHACVVACPFGVITKNPNGKGFIKCDLCVQRLGEGQQPACVEACPTRTIEFEKTDDVSAAKRKQYLATIQGKE